LTLGTHQASVSASPSTLCTLLEPESDNTGLVAMRAARWRSIRSYPEKTRFLLASVRPRANVASLSFPYLVYRLVRVAAFPLKAHEQRLPFVPRVVLRRLRPSRSMKITPFSSLWNATACRKRAFSV